MAAQAAGLDFLHRSLAVADRTRFFKSWLRTNRASHPSGSSDQRWSASALAVCPPQKNLGAASCPMDSQTRGCRCPGANPLLAHVAGDPLCCSGDGQRHSIQIHGSSSRPLTGIAAAVVTHAKQRLTSKGVRSFRMWKQARANLCASALVATTLFVLAFLRS